MRRALRELCENSDIGFHLQPSIIASVFEAEQGVPHTSVAVLGMGAKLVRVFDGLKTAQSMRAPDLPSDVPGKDLLRQVLTEPAEPIGLNGVALNGRLSGFTMPTRYYFRYGIDSENLTDVSPPRYMPAGLYGRVRDGGENVFQRITAYAATVGFDEVDLPDGIHAGNEQAPQLPEHSMKLAMKLEWPFGRDRNHLNGIGIIDLLLGWTTQAHEYGTCTDREIATTYPTLSYPGEGIDLRDAVLALTYRSDDLDAKDFSPVAWLHGRTGTAVFLGSFDDLTAWAVTDDMVPKKFQADGEWHRLEFDFPGQSSRWSFCGSNTEEMGESMARYTYAPIQQIQRDNASGNVCLAFVHGFDLNTPEGSIEIAELEMTYRSRSLLGPGQQAELFAYSENIAGDPGRLTDGSIGDLESCWFTGLDPDEPVDLIWRFRDDVDIESFKLHQCVLAPAKDVALALSTDGELYQDVWHGAMDDTPEDPAAWGGIRAGKGLVCVVILSEPVRARYLRLRIKSGYRQAVAGLDAFEAFGRGLPFMPSPEKFSFSENVEGLPAGNPVFAQLVAENADGLFEGDIIEVRRPDHEMPFILSALVVERQDDMARIAFRTIAMGSMATLNVVLTSDDGEEISPPPISIGKWVAARDVRVIVHGLMPGVSYQGLCRVENEHGVSEDFTFECGANG